MDDYKTNYNKIMKIECEVGQMELNLKNFIIQLTTDINKVSEGKEILVNVQILDRNMNQVGFLKKVTNMSIIYSPTY
jgi:hypothetical protein